MKLRGVLLACAAMAAYPAWGADKPVDNAAAPATEGQAGPDDQSAVTDQSGNDGLSDIVVTARRTNESAQRVPLAISVFDASELKRANVTEVVDIARLTPNFSVTTAGGDATSVLLTIRGQSQQDYILTTESPIGVYVDGVNYIRSSNLEAAFLDVERVEVLKGPQGTLFGKNTTGGALNITTRQPDLTRIGGYAIGVLGNYDRRDITGVLNLPLISDKLGLRLMGNHAEHSGYATDSTGRELGNKNRNAFRANLLFQSGTVRWSLSGDYTREKSNGPIARLAWVNPYPSPAAGTPNPALGLVEVALEAGLITPAMRADPVANAAALTAGYAAAQRLLSTYVTGSYTHVGGGLLGSGQAPTLYAETYGVSSNFSADLTDGLQFRSITAARWLKRQQYADLDATPYYISGVDLRAHVRNLSQEFQVAHEGDGRFNWIVGAYVNEETGVDLSNSVSVKLVSVTLPSTIDGHVRNSSLAFFGQGVFKITDTLRFTGGLRWTQEQKRLRSFNRAGPTGAVCNLPVGVRIGGRCEALFDDTFSAVSYLASVDYQVDPNILLYAKTSRGFKGGGQNLRGNATIAAGFLPFKPETVTDYEVGIKSDLLDRHLRINAALFYSDYKDIQQGIVLPAGTAVVSLTTNAAKARIQGAELEITALPAKGLTLSASGGITDAKFKKFVDVTGDRSGERFQFPKYKFALAASYEIPTSLGAARLSTDYAWQSSQQLVGPAKYADSLLQKSYGLLGARLSLKLEKLDADIAIFGKNLTQTRYAIAGLQYDNSFGFNVQYIGEPRTFGVELTKNF